MADIEKLQVQINGLTKAMEGWKDSNNTLNKSIGGLNDTVDGLQRPLDGLSNRIKSIGDDLIRYNKTVLEGSRSVEVFGTTLNKYEKTLAAVSTSTRYSRQETAELANVFSKGIIGEKDLSLFKEYVSVLDRLGLSSDEASGLLGSLTNAQNKFADANERMKNGGLSTAALLTLSPEDAKNLQIYTKEVSNMNGGLGSSKSAMAEYNNAMRQMQSSVANVTLSMQQAFSPVLQNIGEIIAKITPGIEKIANVIGNVLGSNLATTTAGLAALFAAFTVGLKKALELTSAFSKMPKVIQDVAKSNENLAKSVRADIQAEKEKIGVADDHTKAVKKVGVVADEVAESENNLAESGDKKDRARNRLNRLKKKSGVRGKFRGTKASLLKANRKVKSGLRGIGNKVMGARGVGTATSLGKSAGKNLLGGIKSLSLPTLIAGLGLGAIAEGTKDENKTQSEQSNIHKGLNAATAAVTWGGTGAMIGSMVPVVGTAIGGAVGGVAGAGYSLYNDYIGAGKKEKGLKDFENNVGGKRGVDKTIELFEKDAENKLKNAKNAGESQAILNEKLKRQQDLYTSLKEKAEQANDPTKAADYATKLDEINKQLTENENVYYAISQEILKQNELISTQAEIFGNAASAAGEMASMYSEFYFDGEKATESLKNQTEYLKEQLPVLEARSENMKKVTEFSKMLLEQSKAELENAQDEETKAKVMEKIKKQENDLKENIAKQETIAKETAAQKQKIEKAELETLTKKYDVEQKIHEVKLAQADAAERLAKESMLGIGYSAEAAKQSFDESTNVARVATEKANVLQKEVASVKAQEQSARLAGDITKADQLALKLNNLKVKADEAQTEALNKQGDAMAKLNKLREGYLDSLQEMSFGVGEVSLIPTQDSGLATMSAGAARFGGKGEGRISPAASITGTGGVIKTSGDSGGGNSVYGFRDQEARFFGGPGGVDNRMQNLFNNAGAISNAYGANAAARQQAGPMKEGTTVIVNASPSGVSVGKHDSSNVSVSTKFV